MVITDHPEIPGLAYKINMVMVISLIHTLVVDTNVWTLNY